MRAERALGSFFLGAHARCEPRRPLRVARAALVCCGLLAWSTPAAAQWFDRPQTVRANDEAAEAPPGPAQPPPPPSTAQPPPPASSTGPATSSPNSAAPNSAAPNSGAKSDTTGGAPDERHGESVPAPTVGAPNAAPEPQPSPAASASPATPAASPATPAAREASDAQPIQFRVAVSVEAAFGREDRFRNYLFGPRLDLRFTERTAIGYAVRYANLEGPGDRAHNVLHTVTVEHRLFPASGTGFAVPLRLSGGYLPKNGPFLQPAAGIGFITERVEFLLLPLAPTFWNTGNQTWPSYDVAFEVGVRL